MKNLESFGKLAIKKGAKEARIISVDTIVVSSWVRLKCQFGCDGYGKCLTCPPFSPTPEETAKIIKEYKKAILIHGDEHTDISKIAVYLEREIFLAGYYKAFGMGAGPCELCGDCDVGKPCKKPYLARPSMEANGIDVFQTVRNNGFKIEVLDSVQCKGNYFGVVLVK